MNFDRKRTYLILAIAGTAWPLSFFLPFLWEQGLELGRIVELLFINRISSFFAADLVITAMVVLAFIVWESRRLSVPRLWLSIFFLFTIGVSLALPFFLYMRETVLTPNPK